MSNLVELQKFPTTRYQGSKRKMLPWLYDNLKGLEFNSVLDACGGTGSVSYLFKKMGKHVTYNDVLKFNYLIGIALIENQNVVVTKEDLEYVLNHNPKDSTIGFIEKTFDEFYFTKRENRWLDITVKRINNLNGKNDNETKIKRAMCFYALFQSSLRKRPFNLFHRKNLYLRTNDVKRKFGNKTTWEKEFASEFRFFIDEINNKIFDSNTDCNSTNLSILDFQDTSFDLVYFDTPYITQSTKNETNDYLKCYHFLEGISDYENWDSKIDNTTKNLRFKKENGDNLFTKNKIHNSLDCLFEKFQNSIIVVSYKIGGVPSIEEIEELIGKYKENVVTKTRHYTYALNKQNGDAKYNREVLIIGS